MHATTRSFFEWCVWMSSFFLAETVQVPGQDIVQQGIEFGSECIENARRCSRTIVGEFWSV